MLRHRAAALVLAGFVAGGVLSWRPGPAAGQPAPRQRLHLDRAREVSFNSYYVMTDGGGYRWDINYYGCVYYGTQRAYRRGMMCVVNGSTVRAEGNRGWASAAGDEVEFGPWRHSNVQVHRRVKVYGDRALARWLDIFENPTGAPVTVSVAYKTGSYYGITARKTSSGGSAFGPNDWAILTRSSQAQSPALLHVVTSPKAPQRPKVSISGSYLNVNYDLTIPPGQAVVLCHFESQAHDAAAHDSLMKAFPLRALLKDLHPSVRQRIVNMVVPGYSWDLDLKRSATADVIVLANGDPLAGTITNEAFTLQTLLGELTLPAAKVVGMAQGAGGTARFALVGGQIISGRPATESLTLLRGRSGKLTIPLEKTKQWSFRISAQRPADEGQIGPHVVLRTGDRLCLRAEELDLRLRTRQGVVALEAARLVEIVMDNPGNAVHRVTFLNGSSLGGILEPARLRLPLTIGREITVSRHLVARMQFAEAPEPDDTLTRVMLSNGDELYGTLVDRECRLETNFGPVDVKLASVRQIRFSPQRLRRAVVEMWSGTVLRGRLDGERLGFRVAPGTTLVLSPAHLVAVARPAAMRADQVRERVEVLVARLGAESYTDREAATQDLIKMGATIAPLLRRFTDSNDPEVRQRLQYILERVSHGPARPAPPSPLILRAR